MSVDLGCFFFSTYKNTWIWLSYLRSLLDLLRNKNKELDMSWDLFYDQFNVFFLCQGEIKGLKRELQFPKKEINYS